MKTRQLILLSVLVLLSCEKREVQLAETDSAIVTEVTDISPIYIFYDETTKQAEFNRNNMIGTTNWLVNIDKRLTLKEILPHLIFLQKKRQGDGMHVNQDARNYFSCSNPELQNLSFIEFTSKIYHEQSISEFMKSNPIDDEKEAAVFVNIESDTSVIIGKSFVLHNSSKLKILEDLIALASNDNLTNRVFINFKSDMSFQNYIDFMSILLKLEDGNIIISEHEFIYN